jgi:outer membrane immunogenic protein
VTGRLGFAHQRALYNVKGGVAFADVEAGAKYNSDGAPLFPFQPVTKTSNSQTGWAFGAGMEYALTDKWSVKGEWLHYDLGAETFLIATQPDTTARVNSTGDIARIGINYHFGHQPEHYEHDAMK